MALIKCKECDKEVSSKAKECPHCGAPVESKGTNLSPLHFFVLVIAIMLFIGWIGDKLSGSKPDRTYSIPQKTDVVVANNKRETEQKNIKPKSPIPSISKLTNKSQEEVEQLIGKPDKESKGSLYDYDVIRSEYLHGKVEITYIEKAARYVSLNLEECNKWKQLSENMKECLKYENYFKDYVFTDEGAKKLLSDIGLNTKKGPDFSSQIIKRWTRLHGNYEVSVFEDGKGGIKYILILTDKKYQ